MHSFTQDLVLGGNFNIINNRNTLLFLRIEALIIPTQLKLPGLKGGACVGDMLVRKFTGSCLNPVVALNSALRFTPLEIMPRSVSSPAIAGLEFLTG